jgi:Rad3-related DNA helicase
VPDFKVVVFDEAHSIERIASNQLDLQLILSSSKKIWSTLSYAEKEAHYLKGF